MKAQPFHRRLGFALGGLRTALAQERSLRVHLAAGIAVIALLAILHPPAVWWALGLLAVGLVLVAELLNTAIETLADHLHPERHPAIRAVKDVAAGAVLVASLVAIGVAVAFCLR